MKKKPIRLKIKKARKIFATIVSRAPNKSEAKSNSEGISEERKEKRSVEKFTSSALAHGALCKQLDGTLDFEMGTTILWSSRVMKGFGPMPEKDWILPKNIANRNDYKKYHPFY